MFANFSPSARSRRRKHSRPSAQPHDYKARATGISEPSAAEGKRAQRGRLGGHGRKGLPADSLPIPETIAQFEQALALRPDYQQARENLDIARACQAAPGR